MVLVASKGLLAYGDFIPTKRDTGLPPDVAVFVDFPLYEYEYLGQFGNLRYYFRHDRDIILVKHINGHFIWRTGLDAPFGMDMHTIAANAQTYDELRRVAEPIEERLNATWTAMANSLVTIEFYDDGFNLQRVSSAAHGGTNATSNMVQVGDGHFRLDVQVTVIDLFVPVHIHLGPYGIVYNIYNSEITGADKDVLAAILITPFMGAAGGVRRHFDFDLGEYGDPIPEPMTPGYVFIPDGSGALIRFRENSVALSRYEGSVFGHDVAEALLYHSTLDTGIHNPLMPVFGVTQGYNQQAFVAWATSGAQYMEIIMSPHNNMTYYNFVYPRFVFNSIFHQVYNRRGDGFFTLFPEPRQLDISIEYRFLYGQDASYSGMARAFRNHLIQRGLLTPGRVAQNQDIPLRLDFVMSDVRTSVIGHTNVVVTTAEQVGEIISHMQDAGIYSINGGMLGFQNGGITAGQPWALNFNSAIGGRRAFIDLFGNMQSVGVDVSFAQDYLVINRAQMRLQRNQAFHRNRWGLTAELNNFEGNLPIDEVSFARAASSADWFTRQAAGAYRLGAMSITASGITNQFVSHWARRDSTSAAESIALTANAFANSNLLINAVSPNMYLWAYTHRFLQSPVFSSQKLISTDTVPFLQMVLNNTMEVYGPYSNFSFYTVQDMLRMIDYNVFPSFVVTHEPPHLLSNTNSLNFYSTEFEIYREIILEVYEKVNPVLSQVIGMEWLSRHVLAEGVVLNIYCSASVLINYTGAVFVHNGISVPPQSARVF